jgi:GNAT superfamily N-acetyltransferase
MAHRASRRAERSGRTLTRATVSLVVTDAPAPGIFEPMFLALDASSRPLIGPATPRLLVIPIRDGAGLVTGGLWGLTQFQWLHVEMLIVPGPLRRQGVGSALMVAAENEARGRGCLGAYLDRFSFQATSFYEKLGYEPFGVLENLPPGYSRLYYRKCFGSLQVMQPER